MSGGMDFALPLRRAWTLLLLGLLVLVPLSLTAVSPAIADPGPEQSQPAAVAEDVIRTTAGTVFRGKIIKQDGEKVVIETKSGQVTIPRTIIKELRLGKVDYRPASEKIKPVEIPEDQAAGFLKKAEEHFKKGEMQQTAAICEGLIVLGGKALSAEQRESTGKMLAEAYFELKDWPAAARGLRRAAVSISGETDRKRLLAVAEALEKHKPGSIGDQTVERFAQAQQAAMKWKANRVFDAANKFVEEAKEINRRSNVDRALEIAQIRLAKSEIYVPGYSIQRQPELVKTMVGRMISAVRKAKIRCTEQRKGLKRTHVGNVDRKRAEAWNKQCRAYLDIIEGTRTCLNHIKQLGEKYQIKDLYKADEHKKLGEEMYKLQYYDSDIQAGRRTIKLKGKKIALIKFGSG